MDVMWTNRTLMWLWVYRNANAYVASEVLNVCIYLYMCLQRIVQRRFNQKQSYFIIYLLLAQTHIVYFSYWMV